MWSSFKNVSSSYDEWKHWIGAEVCEIAGIGCQNGTINNSTDVGTASAYSVSNELTTAWETNSISPAYTPSPTVRGSIVAEISHTSIFSYYETSPVASTSSVEVSSVASLIVATSLSSNSSFPTATSPTNVASNGPVQTPTPVTKQPSAQVDHNMRQVLILFVAGLAVGALFYLLMCVELRFFQFVRNVFKLLFEHNSFTNDSEMGLNSESFNTDDNVQREDSRSGLSKMAKLRVMWYMFLYGESFDEARLRYVRYKFSSNGISPDGSPLDPKFVHYD